ncbi:MAG: hypothetical protein SFX72_03660 [Isosphaeraceae bacterium]|nr:hypothetical protein [Isosphaeraceae bacterium]
MRRAIWGMGLLAGLAIFAGEARAQNFSDPFFLYYGYFLPRQQAMAATPTVTDTINAVTAARQGNASTNRANLYDPNGNFAPLEDFENPGGGSRRQDARAPYLQSGRFPSGNIGGTGPGLYYARTARYYPGLRQGVSPNRNVGLSNPRPGGGFGGGVPVARPNVGGGVPGPR